MTFRSMEGEKGKIKNVEDPEGAAFSDGSKREGHTAAAATRDTRYLGTGATVMDAEMLGMAIGWSKSKQVATDSQGGIKQTMGMRDDRPRKG